MEFHYLIQEFLNKKYLQVTTIAALVVVQANAKLMAPVKSILQLLIGNNEMQQ